MALAPRGLPMFLLLPSPNHLRKFVPSSSQSAGGRNPSSYSDHTLSSKTTPTPAEEKRCLRCGALYRDRDNSSTACAFHGHTTGERGLFSLSPPHQGIDGEWTDKSGVIVYRWNEKEKRVNTGITNWKRRWSCCAEYEEQAPPCRQITRKRKLSSLLFQICRFFSSIFMQKEISAAKMTLVVHANGLWYGSLTMMGISFFFSCGLRSPLTFAADILLMRGHKDPTIV